MTDQPFVPSFDDDAGSDRKFVLICSKGNLDMAYPGLILANAALGEGIETHIFFTFWGFDMINKETMGKLKFSYLGNTAMHMPGQFGFSMPQGMAGLPGVTALTTKMMKKQIADLDIPEVPEMLDMITASGGHLWACRMSADMMKLVEDDLYEGVEGIISASDFIELSEGAQVIFI
ncbi:MAG: DsrE/DsrF/DrsH-like family protein [Actinomycetes bacterium]|nr:DsrE/DsrF/DrsH-like family protein [Actinomycetes bacterium]MDX5380532.1 DsrE/DsrF/DrsH-like family protein [Actinomycetes bacterium]MDX5399418.1 DsrE/DsrF/DrsH-like family protein [Actinomycetes bacterium]